MRRYDVDKNRLLDAVRGLLDEGFRYPVLHTAVDHGEGVELVYLFRALGPPGESEVMLAVRLDDDDLRVPSLTPLVPGFNFQEREVYDLFGVFYEGHPDLRRLLLPDGFQGHPLRKRYTLWDGDIQ